MHAPIVEALIDFRVSLQPRFDVNVFRTTFTALTKDYPIVEEIHAVALKGTMNVVASTINQEIADQIIGFRLKNNEGSRLVQFRLDGYTFNHLKPYPRWEAFFEEAVKYWELYLQVAEPTEVTRIALRYINREEFQPGESLPTYIKQPPVLDPAIPADLSSFMLQTYVSSKSQPDMVAGIVQFSEPAVPPKGISFVLDIDASKTGSFVPTDVERLKNYFADLRDFKNEIFFNTVTKKAIDLWKS